MKKLLFYLLVLSVSMIDAVKLLICNTNKPSFLPQITNYAFKPHAKSNLKQSNYNRRWNNQTVSKPNVLPFILFTFMDKKAQLKNSKKSLNSSSDSNNSVKSSSSSSDILDPERLSKKITRIK
jgi:hypothetical protein